MIASAAGINLAAMDNIFIFGDSYTATGYDPAKGIRNIPYGKTSESSSGGLNWIEYLATDNPSTKDTYFNFAVSGATTNNSIVNATIPSFVDQVATFNQYFVPVNSTAVVEVPWISETTLFEDLFNTNILGYNEQLARFVAAMPMALEGTEVALFNTQPFFNTILDNYTNYGLQNNDSYHPTFAVHKLLAEVIAEGASSWPDVIPAKLGVNEFTRLSILYATETRERVPTRILDALGTAIGGRSDLADFYESLPYHLKSQEDILGHRHRAKELKRVWKAFISCGAPKNIGETLDAMLGLSMSQLALRQPKLSSAAASALNATIPAAATVPARSQDTDELPSSAFGLEDDGEKDEDDIAMVAFLFLADVEKLLEVVTEYWQDFAAGRISLITATVGTSQAVELVKTLERNALSAHSLDLGSGLFHNYLNAMMGYADLSPSQTLVRLDQAEDPELARFVSLPVFRAMLSFTDTLWTHRKLTSMI
ncbi:hypothetical protein RQP46_003408 [Phenoliferia psychrophenolica]